MLKRQPSKRLETVILDTFLQTLLPIGNSNSEILLNFAQIENGIIVEISKDIDGDGIDLKGQILSRGLIDMHCHLREPGYEYKETIETEKKADVNLQNFDG